MKHAMVLLGFEALIQVYLWIECLVYYYSTEMIGDFIKNSQDLP